MLRQFKTVTQMYVEMIMELQQENKRLKEQLSHSSVSALLHLTMLMPSVSKKS